MPTFRKNYLSPESQDWVREVESRTVALEYSLTRTNANLRSTEIQLNSSYNRLDSAVTTLQDNQADIQTALADAQSAINSVLGLGSPDGNPVDGGNLINGTVSGAKIVANSITADEINSDYVYAGTIDADQINAGTLTGFTIRTSASGRRVEVSGADNGIKFVDQAGSTLGWLAPATFGGTDYAIALHTGSTANVVNTSGPNVYVGEYNVSLQGDSNTGIIIGGNSPGLWSGEVALLIQNELYIEAGGGSAFRALTNANGQLETSQGFRVDTGGALNVASGAEINYAAPTSASGSPVYIQTNNLLVEFTSSREYKTQIEDISFDYEKLLNVEMKSFKYNDDITRYGDEALRVYGYIAEDLHDAGLTDLVIYKRLEDGTDVPHSLQFNSLNAIYHSVVQMHHKKIAELEQKVTELQNG